MFDKNTPMALGDIFSVTFGLLKTTFTKSILVVLIFLIPAAYILASGLSSFLGNMPLGEARDFDPEEAITFASGIIYYFSSLGIFMLLYLAAWIGVTSLASEEMKGKRCSIGDAFRAIFSVVYFKVLGQSLIVGAAAAGIMIFPILIIVLGGVMQSPLLAFAGVITMLGAVFFMVYIIILWYFASVNIVSSGDGVLASLSKSSWLVKNYWWRTFGIIILISILLNIAVSIISAPITFFIMWDFIVAAFSSPESFEGTISPEIATLLQSLIKKIGYVIAVTTTLQLVVMPLFTIVIYYDLRIRKKDFYNGVPSGNNPYLPEEPSFGA